MELFSARPQSLSDSTRLTSVARAAFIFLTNSQSNGQKYTADFTGRLGGSQWSRQDEAWAAICCQMRGRSTWRSLILGVGWNSSYQGWENSYNIINLSLHIQTPEIIKAEYETQFETHGNKQRKNVGVFFWLDFVFIPPRVTILCSQWGYSPLENALKCLQNSLGLAKCTSQVNSILLFFFLI